MNEIDLENELAADRAPRRFNVISVRFGLFVNVRSKRGTRTISGIVEIEKSKNNYG